MRKHTRVDQYRVKEGPLASVSDPQSNAGGFFIPFRTVLLCIVSDDGKKSGWEHVSVTVRTNQNQALKRFPTWEEMCHIKKLFWHDDETVIQYHPDEKHYVDVFPFCLNLWKKSGESFELPPRDYVG